MKKRIWIPLVVLFVAAVLLVPVPSGEYRDGGTQEYTALTYKIVDWNRLTADTAYDKTKIYFFPDNFKSVDQLWETEAPHADYFFTATVLAVYESSVLVQPVEGSSVLSSSDRISFGTENLEKINVSEGSVVQVTFGGYVMESYPAQIVATSWKLADDLRHMTYPEIWLDKSIAEPMGNELFEHIKITKIYADCFFARSVISLPYEIKLNGTLSEDWCVGDQIYCTYENVFMDSEAYRIEADLLTVEPSDWEPEQGVAYKPVIYLYPETETSVSVSLSLDGRLTCTYPAYGEGWKVVASPDGTLTDGEGQTYNYLYWEGELNRSFDLSQGFCVKGADTAAFLEEALVQLGLTRREANEFIVYWLPLMEKNPYNIISFQTDAYTDGAVLEIDPAPDTLLRVFMAWQPTDSFVSLPPQTLSAPLREGFTVVEWGGTELAKN